MYIKTESERLGYIMRNQNKFKSEEYAHLKDTVSNDAPGTELGELCILASCFMGIARQQKNARCIDIC